MTDPESPPAEGVALRSVVAASMPLLVAAAGQQGRAGDLRRALSDAGLQPLLGFIGADLPRGAKVGFSLSGNELRLVDERDDTLLRAPREGLDVEWVAAAKRVRGTILVVVDGMDLSGDEAPAALVARVHARAEAGDALGAIVGVVEERPTLPLLF